MDAYTQSMIPNFLVEKWFSSISLVFMQFTDVVASQLYLYLKDFYSKTSFADCEEAVVFSLDNSPLFPVVTNGKIAEMQLNMNKSLEDIFRELCCYFEISYLLVRSIFVD